jgi:hypothetical protein
MQTQLTTRCSLDKVNQQAPAVEFVREIATKKKRKDFMITIVRVKLFFWKLSPLHWYDDFKEMNINMDEFICKKKAVTDKP